jgi:hypothetical protein
VGANGLNFPISIHCVISQHFLFLLLPCPSCQRKRVELHPSRFNTILADAVVTGSVEYKILYLFYMTFKRICKWFLKYSRMLASGEQIVASWRSAIHDRVTHFVKPVNSSSLLFRLYQPYHLENYRKQIACKT